MERVDHGRVRDLDDPVRGLDDVEPERLRAPLLDRLSRALDVQADLAAEEVARVQPPEDDVRVGHGRLRAAAPVADRARIGPGALRADAQEPARVDPGDRAATGSDLDEVDDRRPDGVAGERHPADPGAGVAADVVVLGHRRLPVLDQPDLGGRAAHVEGEDVGPVERLTEVGGGDHAGGRARLDHEHRPAARGLGAEDAAARLHHEQLRPHARVGETALDPLQVALDDRADDGVDHRRRGAQVLAELRRHLGGERDRDARQLLGEDRADPLLVLRVHVRVEEADGDRLDFLAPQDRRGGAHRVVVERPQHLAGRAEPLGDRHRTVARDERRRLLELRVVERGPHLAGDLEQVAKPFGGDEAAARDLPLDDRVRRHRRRVDDEADLPGRHLAVGERSLDGLHEALGGVGRCRQHLRDRDGAGLLVDQGRVGEGAADVDGHAHAHRRSTSVAASSSRRSAIATR